MNLPSTAILSFSTNNFYTMTCWESGAGAMWEEGSKMWLINFTVCACGVGNGDATGWNRGGNLNHDHSYLIVRRCRCHNSGGGAVSQWTSNFGDMGMTMLWRCEFIEQTQDYCIRPITGDIEVHESTFAGCTMYVSTPAAWTVTFVNCVFDSPPLPAAAASMTFRAGNVVAAGPFTPWAQCVEVSPAACTINAQCSPDPQETPWRTPTAPAGCSEFRTGFAQPRVASIGGSVCCVDCAFVYITFNGNGAVASITGGSATFEHCAFHTCTASGSGGGIYTASAGVLLINHCCVHTMRTTGSSGEGAFMWTDLSQRYNVNTCDVYWCVTAAQGGAVRAGSHGSSEFSNFTRCRTTSTADYGGGTFYIRYPQYETIHHLLIDGCGAVTARAGAIRQYWSVPSGSQDTHLNSLVFIRGDGSGCVNSWAEVVFLEDCQFISCTYLFSLSLAGRISVSDCTFDWSRGPVTSTVGITVTNCGYALDLQPSLTCFQADPLGATWGCAIAMTCPAASVQETAPETNEESKTASEDETPEETVLETDSESKSESRSESKTASVPETPSASKKESEFASKIASPEASSSPSAVPLPAATALVPDSSQFSLAASSDSQEEAGAGGGGSLLWTIGLAIGCVIVGAAAMAVFCYVIRGPSDRIAGKEEEGKAELDQRRPPAQQSSPPVQEAVAEQEDNDKLESGSDHDSSPAVKEDSSKEDSSKEEPAERRGVNGAPAGWGSSSPREGGSSEVAKPEFEFSGEDAPAPFSGPGAKPAKDDIEIIDGEPVRIVSAIGGRATIAIPFKKQLWARRQIRAHFAPEHAELWLSSDKGTIEPGASEFPFALFFGPTEVVSFETTLIVAFGDFEIHVPIVASTEGARRHRHHRSE
jgi:hypothetical protein